jgi:hypothetical protein
MVMRDAYSGWSVLSPTEDDAPLVINPDGVEAAQNALQYFESVARGHGQVTELARLVELDQFSQGHPGDGRMPSILLLMEELLGVGIGKRLDHRGKRQSRRRHLSSAARGMTAGWRIVREASVVWADGEMHCHQRWQESGPEVVGSSSAINLGLAASSQPEPVSSASELFSAAG